MLCLLFPTFMLFHFAQQKFGSTIYLEKKKVSPIFVLLLYFLYLSHNPNLLAYQTLTILGYSTFLNVLYFLSRSSSLLMSRCKACGAHLFLVIQPPLLQASTAPRLVS